MIFALPHGQKDVFRAKPAKQDKAAKCAKCLPPHVVSSLSDHRDFTLLGAKCCYRLGMGSGSEPIMTMYSPAPI
jgi:hypothetical protein